MGVLEFLVPFYPINTARVVFSSDLKMDPLNLYPNRGGLVNDVRPFGRTEPSFIEQREQIGLSNDKNVQ